MPQLRHPAGGGRARATIEAAAAEAGREVEDDHYGTNIAVLAGDRTEADAAAAAALAATARRRPDVDPSELLAVGWAGAREQQVRRFVAAGITRFVVRPAAPIPSWPGFLDAFCDELVGLEDELSTVEAR